MKNKARAFCLEFIAMLTPIPYTVPIHEFRLPRIAPPIQEEFSQLSISSNAWKPYPFHEYKEEDYIFSNHDDLSEFPYLWVDGRSVWENGQLVPKRAKKNLIILKHGPPEGCDKETFHLRLLEKVSSNPREAYSISEGRGYYGNVFMATLTEDEHARLIGMDEVQKVVEDYSNCATTF